MTMRLLSAILPLVVISACVACTADGGAGATPSPESSSSLDAVSVSEAIDVSASGDPIRVAATLVTEDGTPFLCDSVEDSKPEQCGDPKLELTGADLGLFDLSTSDGESTGTVDIVVIVDSGIAEFVRDGVE